MTVIQVRLLTGVSEEIQTQWFNDAEKIESYIVNVGVTMCPTAYAAAVNGAVAFEPLPHYQNKKKSFF